MLCAALMFAQLAHEVHHPLRLMLSAELGLPPWHAIRAHRLAPRILALLVLDVRQPLMLAPLAHEVHHPLLLML